MSSATLSGVVCKVCKNIPRTRPSSHVSQIGQLYTWTNRQKHVHRKSVNQLGTSLRSRCLYGTETSQNTTTVFQENNETLIRSPYKDVQSVDQTFGEFMFSFLDKYRNLELMVDFPTGCSYTGAQMKEVAIKMASGLHKLGYRKGDTVIFFSTNCPEYTILFMACGVLGLPVSTANPVYTPGELARQITHSGSVAVFTQENMLPVVREAIASSQEASQNIKHIFTFDTSPDGCFPIKNLMEDDGRAFPENVDINPGEDILTLPYSSGTTGLPKGVMLTHKNLIMNLIQGMEGQMKFRAGEETLMGLLPFYHIYGLMVLQFGSLSQGAKVIVMPKFEPETFLQAIQDHKVTYAHLVPPVVLFLAKHPMVQNFQTSSINTIISAAAPLGVGVTLETEERLECNLLQAYGLTECSPITHYDEYPHKRGTIGRLVPSTLAKIVDQETGQTLDPGEVGEMLIKGPQVMKGYYKNQEATDGCIKDDWFYTGDLCHVDEEGHFTVSDRLKELIKYKGLQVAPAELEALLCTHPAIQDAAVIGIPAGEEVGEVPKAYVVTKPGVSIKSDAVLDFVKDNVAPYKKLRGGVEFVEQIPKTASGKILRRMLKK